MRISVGARGREGGPFRGSFRPLTAVELEASESEATDSSWNFDGGGVRCARPSKAWQRIVGIVALLGFAGLCFGWLHLSAKVSAKAALGPGERNAPLEGGDGIVRLASVPGVGGFFSNIIRPFAGLMNHKPATSERSSSLDSTTTSTTTQEPVTTSWEPLTTSEAAQDVTEAACHTAVPGEECYDQVYWAVTEGIVQHPEWYVGLGPDSPIELFQGVLARRGKCPRPCNTFTILTRTTTSITTTTTTQRPWQYPALFCFSVAMKDTYEMDIMSKQRDQGVGIFACEEAAVLCENETDLGGGVSTITFPHADVGKSKDGTAGNAEVFMNAWHAVHKDGRYLRTHFVVKMDPDAVLIPDRLRPRVEDHIMEGPVFFLNCNRYPQNPDYPMMYGAMEVYSTSAIQAYIEGEEKCKQEIPIWPLLGEDSFMTKCLERLDVKAVLDNDMVSDDRCFGIDCRKPHAAGFHEFKNVDGWFHCLAEAAAVDAAKPHSLV